MPELRRWWGLLLVAVQALTRVPVHAPHGDRLLRAAAVCFPIVGIGIGLFAGAVMLVATGHLAALPSALLTIAAATLLTGALHEDGLADCCDALGAGSRQDALRIMRDSRIGAFGTVGLVLVLALRASLLAAVPAPLPVLVAAHAASRFWMLVPGALLPYARDHGMAGTLTRPAAASLLAAAVLETGETDGPAGVAPAESPWVAGSR